MQEFTIVDKMDNEFIYLIMEIDKWSGKLTKHNKLKLDSWVRIIPKQLLSR